MAASEIKPKIIIIAGPTASGKTELSLQLAKELNGEIINIDSIQIYKHFDIGSAKIAYDLRQDIPHHLIDILEPTETFNVASYKKLADHLVQDIASRGKVPIFVGGSTLYIKVLLHGLTAEMGSDLKLRNELESENLEILVAKLQNLDPELCKKIDLQNKRRVVRALESIGSNQGTVSAAHNKHNFENIDYQALIILNDISREVLYQRINQRVEDMLAEGLISETNKIIQDYGNNCPALRSIGYQEATKHLSGELSQKELGQLIAQNTRRFAKKQLTFWRNEPKKRGWSEIKNTYSNHESNLTASSSKIDTDLYRNQIASNISNIFSGLGVHGQGMISIFRYIR